MTTERSFRVEMQEPMHSIQEIAQSNWKLPAHPLGPGVVRMDTMSRRFGIYAGLRFQGLHDAAADMFKHVLENVTATLLDKGRMRDATGKADAVEATGHVFFEELYLRLEAAEIPKHVCERIHLIVSRANESGDYFLYVQVTMLGQPGWQTKDLLANFPSARVVNEILMLA
jgi:hypothetical protein